LDVIRYSAATPQHPLPKICDARLMAQTMTRPARATDCDMVNAGLGESRDVLHRRRLIAENGARDAEPLSDTRRRKSAARIPANAGPGIRRRILGDIPEDVLRFLADKIDSVPHLEALLLLAENPAQAWTIEQIAGRIYTSKDAAAAILKNLQQSGLIVPDASAPPRYQYDPSWDAQAQLMPKIIETYRRRLVQVASFIHSKASSSVREFARAFDFKKDR
jgi:hypothetical protein